MTTTRSAINKSRKQSIIQYFLLSVVIAYCLLCAVKGGDFDVFLDAAQKMAAHQNIYRPPFIKGLQYYYSPFFALLLIPFSYLPFVIPEFAWLLLSTFLLYRTWVLTSRYFTLTVLSQKQFNWWIFLTLFLAIRFLLYNYSMIQMTIFLMWATLESLALFEKRQFIPGGLLLGFACTTKLLPILFLPYLLYRGYVKGFLSTVFFFGLFLFIPALFIGNQSNTFLLQEWWVVINPANKENSLESDLGTHSLVSLIPVYLTETHNKIDLKRNFIDLTPTQAVLITNIIRLVFVLATLFFLRSLPFKRNTEKLQTIWECAYLFLITPLLFPHQQKYAFLYILPAIIYLFYYLLIIFKVRGKNRFILLTVFSLNALIFTPFISSDLLGRYAYDVLQHFRVLSISTIGLCVLLAVCTSERLSNYLVPQVNQN